MTTIISTPELLQTSDTKLPNVTKPAIEIISDEKLSDNYVPTGITVIIPTNLAKINSEALFACNIDGFLPFFNPTLHSAALFKNFFPVQVTTTGNNIASLRVIWQYVDIPVQFKYLSFRYFSGNVKVGIRISSQTGQTGNFLISQLRSGSRHYYNHDDVYKGLRFLNASSSCVDYAPSSFALGDLSLNRNISITPCRTNPLVYQDHARKIYDVYRYGNGGSDSDAYMCVINQHTEDWLLFEPIFNISGTAASEISMTFYFDFSEVSFFVPMYPILPMPPSEFGQQILLFTNTFKDQVSTDTYRDWKWYPRDAASLLPKEYPNERFGEIVIGGSIKISNKEYANKFISHLKTSTSNLDSYIYPFYRAFSKHWKAHSNSLTTPKPSET